FWRFLNQQGLVYEGGQYRQSRLFDWVYALGYPLTEPYWVQVNIAGQPATVLLQAYQRRVLTYNPANPSAWQVEMGNVGRQYYSWRYALASSAGAPPPVSLPVRPLLSLTALFTRVTQPLYTTAVNVSEWN